MTEAPAFSVLADVAIVKGETPAADRTWLTFPDGTERRAVVHVIHDLPHLVIESVFGLDDGLWGTLAAGSLPGATRAVSEPPRAPRLALATRRHGLLRLVTDPQRDEPEAASGGRLVARAAVNAVLNRWGDGPDTPPGVRARLRCSGSGAAELAGCLDDETIRIAAAGVRRLYRDWSALPPGGTMRLTWPLRASWLRLL